MRSYSIHNAFRDPVFRSGCPPPVLNPRGTSCDLCPFPPSSPQRRPLFLSRWGSFVAVNPHLSVVFSTFWQGFLLRRHHSVFPGGPLLFLSKERPVAPPKRVIIPFDLGW